MRHALFLVAFMLVITLPSAIYAQEQVAKPLLSKIYKDCMATDIPMLSNNDQDYLCSCYIEGIHNDVTSIEDLRTLAMRDKGWIDIKDQMMFGPYWRCTKETAIMFTQKECYGSFEKQPDFKNPYRICACAAGMIDDFFKGSGLNILADKLQSDPQNISPYYDLFRTSIFRNRYQKSIKHCIRTEEYGWKK